MKKSRSKNKKRTSINRFRKNKRNTSKRKRTLKGGGKKKRYYGGYAGEEYYRKKPFRYLGNNHKSNTETVNEYSIYKRNGTTYNYVHNKRYNMIDVFERSKLTEYSFSIYVREGPNYTVRNVKLPVVVNRGGDGEDIKTSKLDETQDGIGPYVSNLEEKFRYVIDQLEIDIDTAKKYFFGDGAVNYKLSIGTAYILNNYDCDSPKKEHINYIYSTLEKQGSENISEIPVLPFSEGTIHYYEKDWIRYFVTPLNAEKNTFNEDEIEKYFRYNQLFSILCRCDAATLPPTFQDAIANTGLVEEESYVVPIDSKKWNNSKTFDNCIWVDIFKNTGTADDNKRFLLFQNKNAGLITEVENIYKSITEIKFSDDEVAADYKISKFENCNTKINGGNKIVFKIGDTTSENNEVVNKFLSGT